MEISKKTYERTVEHMGWTITQELNLMVSNDIKKSNKTGYSIVTWVNDPDGKGEMIIYPPAMEDIEKISVDHSDIKHRIPGLLNIRLEEFKKAVENKIMNKDLDSLLTENGFTVSDISM